MLPPPDFLGALERRTQAEPPSSQAPLPSSLSPQLSEDTNPKYTGGLGSSDGTHGGGGIRRGTGAVGGVDGSPQPLPPTSSLLPRPQPPQRPGGAGSNPAPQGGGRDQLQSMLMAGPDAPSEDGADFGVVYSDDLLG